MKSIRLRLSGLMDAIGAQLLKPSGLRGWMIGTLMAIANARSNTLAVAALELNDGDHLLELGCGPGRALEAAMRSRNLAWAVGVDWSDVMLEQAFRKNRSCLKTGQLVLVRGDFSKLPIADGATDSVLAVNVVYFMDNYSAVAEAHRVLRPGGRIVVYATDESAMRRWRFAGPHTHRLFDQGRLTALLLEAGFASERITVNEINAGFGIMGLLAVATKANT